MSNTDTFQDRHSEVDFKDFFENSLCGFLLATPKGEILRANSRMCIWLDCSPEELIGKRFSNLLSVGGKIHYETHLSPLVKMQGYFDEIAAELVCKNDKRMPVFINGSEHKDGNGNPTILKLIVIDASDRQTYEKNLRIATTVAEQQLSVEREFSLIREQFIAILGHDLRNPIQAIKIGAEILLRKSEDPTDAKIAKTIKNSSERMSELINNIMDFASARLGGGLNTYKKISNPEPYLTNVVDEIRRMSPDRKIETRFEITCEMYCDVNRLAQLLSNLVANAVTHGAQDTAVIISGTTQNGIFELSVINNGKMIPPEAIAKIFEPFKRNEERVSRNGLGLGLFIAHEIAKAHNGQLTAVSSETETRFTFRMPVA